jgi:hypothetical protein
MGAAGEAERERGRASLRLALSGALASLALSGALASLALSGALASLALSGARFARFRIAGVRVASLAHLGVEGGRRRSVLDLGILPMPRCPPHGWPPAACGFHA